MHAARAIGPADPRALERASRASTSARRPRTAAEDLLAATASKLREVNCSTPVVRLRRRSRLDPRATGCTTRPVLHHHALGPPGRARGVDHVRQVLRQERPASGFVAGLASHAAASASSRTHRHARARERAPASRAVRQHRHRRAVLQHVSAAAPRVRRVQRHVRAARLEHRQQPATISGARSTQIATRASGPRPARGGGAPAGWRARSAPRTSAPVRRRPPPPRPACAPPAPRSSSWMYASRG